MTAAESKNSSKNPKLSVAGASLVFYTVRVLEEVFNENEIKAVLNNERFRRIEPATSEEGYIESIFFRNSALNNRHLIFRASEKTKLRPGNAGLIEGLAPIANHYISIYENILLVQSVIVFDKNDVADYDGKTTLSMPLNTRSLLQIIREITTEGKDWNGTLNEGVSAILASFIPKNSKVVASVEQLEQSLSIQIWDIASLNVQKGYEIRGEDLEKEYHTELIVLLSCYNPHLTDDDLWNKLGDEQMKISVRLKTDVLMDHRILLNEQVCIEISQINHPKFRPISRFRVSTYGYDSTSIFLWSYLIMMHSGVEFCGNKSQNLLAEMINIIAKYNENIVHRDLSEIRFSITKVTNGIATIKERLRMYDSLGNICVQQRHKEFVSRGFGVRGLELSVQRMNDVFSEVSKDSSRIISAASSEIGENIAKLLKETEALNKNQSKFSTRLSIISTLIGCSAIVPLTEFIVSFREDLDEPKMKLGIFLALGIILAAVLWGTLRQILGKDEQ